MIDYLIQDCGADVNIILKNHKTPLIKAIEQNNIKMIELLMNYGANINFTSDYYSALNYAIDQRMEDIVHYLVKKGTDIYKRSNYYTPLMNAIKINHHSITKFLIDQINKNFIEITPLIYTIRCHNRNFVKYLIKKCNIDVNEIVNNSTPLMTAIFINKIIAVKHLVEAGADINKINNGHMILNKWPHDESIIAYAINKK